MNSLIAGGVVAVIAALALWLAVLKSKAQGAAEQAQKDLQAAKDAEAAIHQVQAEERDTAETKDRLNKGSF